MKSYCFDASALIGYFDGEPNAIKIANILEDINDNNLQSWLSVINLGEIYYHFLRAGGIKTAQNILSLIKTLPVIIMEAGEELAISAALLKAFNKMSYADCFAAALAIQFDAVLVTGDKEFKQLEKEIKIQWI